ncbi:hypothetical protein AUJ14_02880 [Candidatus Micrarchaeota archaeon CG1_02_55_22]|nr:MAG: hypothetical protein AUJ14_02880 [Candidatus Micrarchaeota archaeon CG1_02_55_22]
MDDQTLLKGKNVLVTGGTGSFGNQIVDRLLLMNPAKITIFSRDENKQYHMCNKYAEHKDLLKFQIGDVRDAARLDEVMYGVDVVFHAAALKHVPQCEYFPFEAVKTNIIGSKNVVEAAIDAGVGQVVTVSTDKAVKPINAMGMSKAIQEKIFFAANGRSDTRFMCVRYGNVIGSRGSVIPRFQQLIKDGKPLTITDERMTRFWLTLDEAINLVFLAVSEGKGGETFVRKMPACKITQLARVMGEVYANRADYPVKVTGLRPGEKIHEILVSEEEMTRTHEFDDHFVTYWYDQAKGAKLRKDWFEYDSKGTEQLSDEQIKALLKKITPPDEVVPEFKPFDAKAK